MVQCERCGHTNDPSARFCVGCGNRLSALPPEPHTANPAVPAAPGHAAPPASHEPAPPPAHRVHSASLPFAETAPPLLDDDLMSRPVANRASRPHPPTTPAELRAPTPHPLGLPPDAPRVLAGILVSFDGNPLGQSWAVYQGTNLVGRLGAALGANVELPHATVSSRHATVYAAAHPGRLILQDHGSTNGTYVNDTALASEQRRELYDGDRVRLGLFNLIVKII